MFIFGIFLKENSPKITTKNIDSFPNVSLSCLKQIYLHVHMFTYCVFFRFYSKKMLPKHFATLFPSQFISKSFFLGMAIFHTAFFHLSSDPNVQVGPLPSQHLTAVPGMRRLTLTLATKGRGRHGEEGICC